MSSCPVDSLTTVVINAVFAALYRRRIHMRPVGSERVSVMEMEDHRDSEKKDCP